MEKEFTIKILVENNSVLAKIKEYKNDKLTCFFIEDKSVPFKTGQDAEIFFSYHNTMCTFSSKIVDITDDRIILGNPEFMYKGLKRKYMRIQKKGDIQVFFQIKDKTIKLNYPKTEKEEKFQKPVIRDNFDINNIKELLHEFQERIKASGFESKIVMLRNKEITSYEERLMQKTAKLIWLQETKEGFPTSDFLPQEKIVTLQDFFSFEVSMGTALNRVKEKVQSYLQGTLFKGIVSQLYCPILYHNYMIGYIFILSKNFENRIEHENVKYTFEFSKILAYSLEKNGYYRDEKKADRQYRAGIIDISASGLLFSHDSDTIIKAIDIGTHLDIILKILNRKISIGTIVKRKFHDNEIWYFGLQYADLRPEDLRFLFEFLYEKQYTNEYKKMWENGIPPSSLDML